MAGLQGGQRLASAVEHLDRFFQEDVPHLGVVFETAGHRRRGCQGCRRRAGGRQGRRCGQRVHRQRGQHQGALVVVVTRQPHRGAGVVWRQAQRDLGQVGTGPGVTGQRIERQHRQTVAAHGRRCRHGLAALRGTRLLDDAVELQRDGQCVGVRLGVPLRAGLGVEVVEAGGPVFTRHHRSQVAGGRVEAEQRLGHLRLHADHVDQETQRAQVVGQAVEAAALDGLCRVDLGIGQFVDIVAHAQHGQRRLVEPQHRQHAAHGLQLRRHRDQHLALGRVAEVLVDVLLDLGQRGAQFLHHAAHGLAVGDAAVQLLHPQIERAGVARLAHRVDALGQALDAGRAVGVVEVAVLDGRVEVQQCGGHLHRQLGGRLATGSHGVGGGHLQRAAQHGAIRVEPGQRIADQRKLLGQAVLAGGIAARHRRPHLLGSGHALARLRHQGRVEAAEAGTFVVDARAGRQAIALAHRRQPRADRLRSVGGGLATEEQQVMRQPLRWLGGLTGTQLGQQLGAQPLAVGIRLQQAIGLCLEEAGRQLPQRGQAAVRRMGSGAPLVGQRLGAQRQAGKHLAHAGGHAGRCAAHQRQQVGLDQPGGPGIGVAYGHAGVQGQIAPRPRHRPQVGRVHPQRASQFLQRLVLREQRQRRHRLAGQAPLDEIQQREAATLQRFDRSRGDQLGPGADALQCGLGGAGQLGGRPQAHDLEHAHALVQLVARLAQHGGVDGVEVATLGLLLQVAAQGLVGQLERAAQLVTHPRQGAQVFAQGARGGVGGGAGVGRHGDSGGPGLSRS